MAFHDLVVRQDFNRRGRLSIPGGLRYPAEIDERMFNLPDQLFGTGVNFRIARRAPLPGPPGQVCRSPSVCPRRRCGYGNRRRRVGESAPANRPVGLWRAAVGSVALGGAIASRAASGSNAMPNILFDFIAIPPCSTIQEWICAATASVSSVSASFHYFDGLTSSNIGNPVIPQWPASFCSVFWDDVADLQWVARFDCVDSSEFRRNWLARGILAFGAEFALGGLGTLMEPPLL